MSHVPQTDAYNNRIRVPGNMVGTGEMLAIERRRAQLSQKKVFDLTGISPSYLCLLEKGGVVRPCFNRVVQLCRLYGVSVEKFADMVVAR